MKQLRRWLTESAQQWGVSARTATWIFWMPLVGAVVVAGARLNKDLYRFLLMEDGPVEWGQFVFFVLACLAGTSVAIRLFRAGHKWQALLYVGFALGMFFISGEEIAWGQRLLGLETPEKLEAVNLQGEITLHNIIGVLGVINLVMMLISGGAAAAFFVNQKIHVEQYWKGADFLFVPPFFLVTSFLIMFLYRLFRRLVWRDPGFTITRYGEWAELCLAFGLGGFAWLNHRRLRNATKPVTAKLEEPLGQSKG